MSTTPTPRRAASASSRSISAPARAPDAACTPPTPSAESGCGPANCLRSTARTRPPAGRTPPFSAILRGGMILFLGCGLRANTAMHAVEEHAPPPYLFGPPRLYTITDENGQTFQRVYTPHGFAGSTQRYDRVAGLLAPPALQSGYVGAAAAFLLDGPALLDAALAALRRNPHCFVEPHGAEGA
jgi:aminoglycoside N3'-acetyltransferase